MSRLRDGDPAARDARGDAGDICARRKRGARVYTPVRSISPIGRVRIRLPVAAKIALPTAGAIGGVAGSPMPPAASPWHDVHLDRGHFGHRRRADSRGSCLDHAAVLEGDLPSTRPTGRRRCRLDLRGDRVRVDHHAAVDRATSGAPSARRRPAPRPRRPAATKLPNSSCSAMPRKRRPGPAKRVAPAGLLGRQLEHARVARLLGEQRAPELDGSCPAARASSSMKLSMMKPFEACPTERQKPTGTACSAAVVDAEVRDAVRRSARPRSRSVDPVLDELREHAAMIEGDDAAVLKAIDPPVGIEPACIRFSSPGGRSRAACRPRASRSPSPARRRPWTCAPHRARSRARSAGRSRRRGTSYGSRSLGRHW